MYFSLIPTSFSILDTVKPRVSGYLLPSKKCPDTSECPISGVLGK